MTGSRAEPGASNACGQCGLTPPLWTIVRTGDVVVSWSCAEHLSAVCEGLQRDFEVTELTVTYTPKAREVAEINCMIRGGFDA